MSSEMFKEMEMGDSGLTEGIQTVDISKKPQAPHKGIHNLPARPLGNYLGMDR